VSGREPHPQAWGWAVPPQLADMHAYDVPPAGPEWVRLHANECPEPWPAAVIDAIAEAVRAVELGRYPDTSGRALRARLAARHGCDPDCVVLGNGSDEIIGFLCAALAGTPARPGALVIPSPTFVMYAHTAKVVGLPVREVPLTAALELDEPALAAAMAGASLAFFARPNNPTSSLWDAGVIERLAHAHPGCVVVVDEAYGAYAPGTSLWRADLPPNRVHMGTLSKIGLAAVRLGYAIAPPALARAMNVIRHPYNVSATTLAIAEVVLERFVPEMDAMVAAARAQRERLAALLGRLPGATVLPAHGNMVLARFDPLERAAALTAYLHGERILVKDVSRMPGLAGCVRASVGTAAELDRLEAALAAWRPQ
jgi:histidinol-phosphate aminotransferase